MIIVTEGVDLGTLTIELDVVVQNWVAHTRSTDAQVAAVVKADAYGLGALPITAALHKAGCRAFYVATRAEAVELCSITEPETIYILTPLVDDLPEIWRRGCIPVLSTLEQLALWSDLNVSSAQLKASALQVETGMHRLGVEYKHLASSERLIKGAGVNMVMSHLACADIPGHELNAAQLSVFRESVALIRVFLPEVKACFANSAGFSLGRDYHFDMVRIGISLYGGCGLAGGLMSADMRILPQPVVSLSLPLIQVKSISGDDTVGYGAEGVLPDGGYIAIALGGYADGLFRGLWPGFIVSIKGFSVPVIGRVSMDLLALDLTAVPEALCQSMEREIEPGLCVDILSKRQGANELAEAANTISYEVLTSLGRRYERLYVSQEVV